MSPNKTITDLLKQRSALERKAEELERELIEAQNDIASIDNVIRLLGGHIDVRAAFTPIPSPASSGGTWSALLHGLRQIDAVKVIARTQPKLEIKVSFVRDILIESGISNGQRTYLGQQLHRLINKDPDFQRVAPGRFRLVEGNERTQPVMYFQPEEQQSGEVYAEQDDEERQAN